MEVVGYLGDAQLRGLQQEGGFHQQHLIDIIYNGTARDLANYAGEIDGRDMEPLGIERNVVVFYKVAGQQTGEADEDFFYTLGRLAVYDGALLSVLQVEQEDGIEHAQHLTFIDVVGMNIADDFFHFCYQMLCGIWSQCLFRLMQLNDRQVGQMHEVVDGRDLDGDMLISHQAVAVKIVGRGDDVNGEARRIGVQVVGMKRQFTTIVVNRHPPFVNQHKGEAGNESPQQVATKDFYRICFKAVHPGVPAFFGQIVAYKYRQIFIQRVHL